MTDYSHLGWNSGTALPELERIRTDCAGYGFETDQLDRRIALLKAASGQPLTRHIEHAPHTAPLPNSEQRKPTKAKPPAKEPDFSEDKGLDDKLGEGQTAVLSEDIYRTLKWLRKDAREDAGEDRKLFYDLLVRNVFAHILSRIYLAKAKREELGKRIAALESKAMHWEGVWKRDVQYTAGACCSDRGSLWVSVVETKAVRPGDQNACWKLVAKNGGAR